MILRTNYSTMEKVSQDATCITKCMSFQETYQMKYILKVSKLALALHSYVYPFILHILYCVVMCICIIFLFLFCFGHPLHRFLWTEKY